jgi:hypothetical protein
VRKRGLHALQARCLVTRWERVSFDWQKEAVWDKVSTAVPPRQRRHPEPCSIVKRDERCSAVRLPPQVSSQVAGALLGSQLPSWSGAFPVALASSVPDRAKRMDDVRINDRAGRDVVLSLASGGWPRRASVRKGYAFRIRWRKRHRVVSFSGETAPRSTPTNRYSAGDTYSASATLGSDMSNLCWMESLRSRISSPTRRSLLQASVSCGVPSASSNDQKQSAASHAKTTRDRSSAHTCP